jgi:hypothetical protein
VTVLKTREGPCCRIRPRWLKTEPGAGCAAQCARDKLRDLRRTSCEVGLVLVLVSELLAVVVLGSSHTRVSPKFSRKIRHPAYIRVASSPRY